MALGAVVAVAGAVVSAVLWLSATNIKANTAYGIACDAKEMAHGNTECVKEVKVELRASNEKIDLNQSAIMRELDQVQKGMIRIEDKMK